MSSFRDRSRPGELARAVLTGQDTAFLRFVAVGCTNFLVSFAVFRLALKWLPALEARAAVSQILSYAAGIAWSYAWNRTFTFRSRAAVAPQAARFVAVQMGFLLLSAGSVGWLVDRLGWPATPAWLLVMTVVTVANFLAMRAWVFR